MIISEIINEAIDRYITTHVKTDLRKEFITYNISDEQSFPYLQSPQFKALNTELDSLLQHLKHPDMGLYSLNNKESKEYLNYLHYIADTIWEVTHPPSTPSILSHVTFNNKKIKGIPYKNVKRHGVIYTYNNDNQHLNIIRFKGCLGSFVYKSMFVNVQNISTIQLDYPFITIPKLLCNTPNENQYIQTSKMKTKPSNSFKLTSNTMLVKAI